MNQTTNVFQPADNGAIYTCLGHHPTLDAPLKVFHYIHCLESITIRPS